MGLTTREEDEIVTQWREANSRIVDLWHALEDAATGVLAYGGSAPVAGKLRLERYAAEGQEGLTVSLPSGRLLVYPHMAQGVNRFGKPSLSYMGVNQETRKYERLETYGGKLTENIVQAIARDCLAVAMLRAQAAGIRIVFHVHDELVCEVDRPEALEHLKAIFAQPITWAPGLPLSGAGYLTSYYIKD